LGGGVHALLDPGRKSVLGEGDALLLELVGLLAGEVDLDRGGALLRDLLAEFVAVLSGRQQQGYLLGGDVGAVDLDLVGVGSLRTSVLRLGYGCVMSSSVGGARGVRSTISYSHPRDMNSRLPNQSRVSLVTLS